MLFIPGGLVWILKWKPSVGPYMVGERYPFGNYIEAWEVSMGFAFLAFGILFSGAVVLVSQLKQRWAWNGLLLSWLLLMFPHAAIAIALMINDPSLSNLGVSKYGIPFAVVWFVIIVIGFGKSLREIEKEKIHEIPKYSRKEEGD